MTLTQFNISVSIDPKNPRDILFTFSPDGPDLSSESLKFKRDVEVLLSTLRGKYPEEACRSDPSIQLCFDRFLTKLIGTAQLGLVGTKPRLELARDELGVLHQEISIEPNYRDRHSARERLLRPMPLVFFGIGVLLSVVGGLINWLDGSGDTQLEIYQFKLKTWHGGVAVMLGGLFMILLGIRRFLTSVDRI